MQVKVARDSPKLGSSSNGHQQVIVDFDEISSKTA